MPETFKYFRKYLTGETEQGEYSYNQIVLNDDEYNASGESLINWAGKAKKGDTFQSTNGFFYEKL